MNLSYRVTLWQTVLQGIYPHARRSLYFVLKLISSYLYVSIRKATVYFNSFTSIFSANQCLYFVVIKLALKMLDPITFKFYLVTLETSIGFYNQLTSNLIINIYLQVLAPRSVLYQFYAGRSLQITAFLELINLLPQSKLNEHGRWKRKIHPIHGKLCMAHL